ncbi:MAG: VPLPA-CTERM sorting domain-containing protein [Chromatiales bacterium]|nr:VPLPA-CTERM sorting domain-containing protein [Chromatiales bacterium]
MTTRITTQLLAAAALLGLSAGAQANGVQVQPSIYLLPSNASVSLNEGTATLELFMDFTGRPLIGGGIDLAFGGPISLISFTPSAYFNSLDTNPLLPTDFTGFGTENTAADFEIFWGNFAGTGGDGPKKLGDLTFSLNGLGVATVDVIISEFWGGAFFDLDSEPMDVAVSGASLQVVPVPAAAWLFVSAIGALGGMRLRRAA